MEQIVGVRFKPAGKIYYFDGNDLELHLDDGVIVETSRGLEYGYVVTMPTEAEKDEENPMKPVIRRATIKDMAQLERNKAREKSAFDICLQKIEKFKVPMLVVHSEKDYRVPVCQGLMLFTALQRRGIEAEKHDARRDPAIVAEFAHG